MKCVSAIYQGAQSQNSTPYLEKSTTKMELAQPNCICDVFTIFPISYFLSPDFLDEMTSNDQIQTG